MNDGRIPRWAAATLPIGHVGQDAEVVARALLGARLVSEIDGVRTEGRIVETEAYLGTEDPASHAFRGRRHAQNAAVYSAPGTWYIYRSHGLHWCACLCTSGPHPGSAILLRAVEPLDGLDAMRARRGPAVPDQLLAAGPGRLAAAFGITRAQDGMRMAAESVLRVEADAGPAEIRVGPRIGITKAVEWPLRFGCGDRRWWSRPFPSP